MTKDKVVVDTDQLTYNWVFDDDEVREPIYIYPVAKNGKRLLGIGNVTLRDGRKIEVHINPPTVADVSLMTSAVDQTPHDANTELICSLCRKWGDLDFVLPQDIGAELEAVADVGRAISQCFPSGAAIIKGRPPGSSQADLSAERK